MENRWNPSEASSFDGPVAECVYCTRLIGADPYLVLHGGGNSSVKAPYRDITGDDVEAIFVKGSGWDMAAMEAPGMPALRLDRVRELGALEALSDEDMMRELDAARFDPGAPSPSVETLLHAFIPHPAVLHSHADVIVTLTNLEVPDALTREIYGVDVVIVPYVMPGFELARAVRKIWGEQAREDTVGMVLLNHGLFTFGSTSAEAYRRHVDLISRAEAWLDRHAPWAPPGTGRDERAAAPEDLADLRRDISDAAGRPMIVQRHTDASTQRFVARPDLPDLASRGPLTPDHVIRTKRVPLVGRDVEGYARHYHRYVEEHRHRARTDLVELDPAPRVILDPQLGMLAVGPTAKDAGIAADIYGHTIPVLERAEDHLGGYRALPAADLFDMEYWALEQAKLRRSGPPRELSGQVAVVTGAASGIGRACAASLLERGACVIGIDRAGGVADVFAGPAWLGVRADVTDSSAQRDALAAGVDRFGGIDVGVVSAGVFPASQPIAELDRAVWRSVMEVNLDAVVDLLSALHPMLVRSPVGARVVLIGSKNVAAPGRGAGAYSASKAALTQIGRVAALEWADDGVTVNVVHPDAVFDTGIWSDEIIAERASRYGLTADEYRRRNLLRAEITAADVAAMVTTLCSPAFRLTTGAQIPIDGGNERVV